MHDQYKIKVQNLTEELKRLEKEEKNSLELLRCREEELMARNDMLLWEKNNEKVQVGIFQMTSCFFNARKIVSIKLIYVLV